MKPFKHNKYIKGLILIFVLYVFFALVLSIIPVNFLEFEQDNGVVTDTKSFIFTTAGDYGATKHTEKVLELINNINPSFNIALGDLSYSQIVPESNWCKFVKSKILNIPFLLLSGNHESVGEKEDGDIHKFANCLPFNLDTPFKGVYAEQYFFDYPKKDPLARFILVTPGIVFEGGRKYDDSLDGKDYKYVQNLIRDAKKENISWVVVGTHKVCISTEQKKCEIGKDFANMLIKEGVNIVISGHVHAYERTFPLVCMDVGKFNKECVKNGDKTSYNEKDGTIFVTAGTGGVDLRDISFRDVEAPYFSSIFGKKEGHFGVFKSIVSKNSFQSEFIDAGTGKVVDFFSINK